MKHVQHLTLAKIFLLTIMAIPVCSLRFSYYPNITSAHGTDFIFAEDSNLAGGALQVTMDSRNSLLVNQAGRVVHMKTLRLWGHKKTDVASFNTTFVLNILPLTDPGGEGLAFILASDRTVPSSSYGPWLGIVNQETNGKSRNQIVAIEFDTRKSLGDIDSNHIAVDVNSINSTFQFPLDRSLINLSSGMDVLVKIRYNGMSGVMTIDLSMGNGTASGQPTSSFSFPLNLTSHLPQDVHVGFSASTSNFTELNCIRSWNFTSSDVGKGSWGPLKWVLPVAIVVLIAFLAAALTGISSCLRRENHKVDPRGCSKQFTFKELRVATSDFDPSRELGHGGFGTVYRGTIKSTKTIFFWRKNKTEVAIKRFSPNSCQGEKEFESEVTIISSLNHPNLVKLIGWCRERGELLLAYKFLPGGSLDNLLFFKERPTTNLSWDQRYKILQQVASTLSYLHDDQEHSLIFHRDVKSSNVMLDSEFNAYLGDFGLARTVKEGSSHHTTKVLNGTAGYVAPEYIETSRATIKTDVYAFGALVAEICCGQKPIPDMAIPWKNTVISYIWELHRTGNILKAADCRLGDFARDHMELALKLALLCCQHNEAYRPTSSLVLKVLMGEERLPNLYQESNPSARSSSKSLQELLEEEKHLLQS